VRTVVVDNASADGSADLVRDEFPKADLVPLAENAGFGPANNIAFTRCEREYVLLLNSDAFLAPGAEPLADEDLGKAALTELFESVRNEDTPIIVERVVADIDEIVRYVRFAGWQNTHAGEREVKMALRKTLFKYRLHQDQELFDRAYGYIRQYY